MVSGRDASKRLTGDNKQVNVRNHRRCQWTRGGGEGGRGLPQAMDLQEASECEAILS